MTSISAILNSVNVSPVVKRLDVWHEAGGIGRWELKLDNLTDVSQIIAPNHTATLGINGTTVMSGYVDDIIAENSDATAVSSRYTKVTGRNYGRDLACKFLIKKYAGVPLNDMVNDALQQAGSEITGVGGLPAPIPLIDAEFNKTYLQNGFAEAFSKVGWDSTVTNNK